MQHSDLICHQVTQTVTHCTVDANTFHGYLMTGGILLLILWMLMLLSLMVIVLTKLSEAK